MLQPGLHILHGGPGVGKTAFALQVAASCGFPALYLTCEMTPLELLRRIAARVTRTYLGRLKSGELSPEDSLAKARQAVQAAPRLAIADGCDAYASLEWLRDRARDIQGDARHVFLAVDSVHSWADGAPTDLTEYDRLNAGISSMRVLAGQLDAPILLVAERNRSSMAAGGLNASAGTRKFEYTGWSVLDLNASEEKGNGGPGAAGLSSEERPVVCHVAKNRSGDAGKRIKLAFHGALQTFRDLGDA